MSSVPCPNVACDNKKLKQGDLDHFGYDGFSCLKCGGEYSFPYSIGYFDGASDLEATCELFREALKSLEHLINTTNNNLREWHNEGLVECRGDEDCDHCHQLYLSKECQDFLNKPEIVQLRGEK